MSLTLISTPEKTVNGILSNVIAGRSQVPFEFLTTDQANDKFKIIIDLLDTLDQPLLTISFKYSPKPDGALYVDFGRIITELNEARGALATEFKIQYSSEWEGGTTAPVIIGPWLAVYGSKQILSEGGANMWDYVLNNINTRALTKFRNPRFWSGFQRTASAFMDSNFNTRTGLTQFRIKNTFYDINREELSTLFGPYNTDLTPRLGIAPIINGGSFVGVSLEGLTEEIQYEQTDVCANPVMVDWVNSLGGVDQWLFNMDQLYERDAKAGLSWETAITQDISTVNRTKSRNSPNWTQQIICKAENLTLDQFKALEEIKSSNSVRIWLSSDGVDWVGVIVSAKFKSMYNAQDPRHEITLQMELPDNFDLKEALNYAGIDDLTDSDQEDLIDSDLEILTG